MATVSERIDRYQRDHLAVGYPIAVFNRYKEHNGARLAANVSYYAFFSVFPLMLAFVSILGLVLEGDDELREDLVDSAISEIPVLGRQIQDANQPLEGTLLVTIVGIAAALWAGTKMIDALAFAFNEQWDVPFGTRPSGILSRLKGIVVLGVFGVGMMGATFLAGIPAAFNLGAIGPLIGLAASAATNILVIAVATKLLVVRRLSVADIWPGSVIAGIGILVLQQLGVVIVRQLSGSSDTYGTFGGIIGLLAWFHLIFQVLLLSSEVNGVRARHLVPRTLSPKLPQRTDGDRRATLLDVQRVQRNPRIGFAVALEGETLTDGDVT